MYCYYDLKPLADQLHDEKLREAHERHLAKRAKAARESCRARSRVGFVRAGVFGPLHGAASLE